MPVISIYCADAFRGKAGDDAPLETIEDNCNKMKGKCMVLADALGLGFLLYVPHAEDWLLPVWRQGAATSAQIITHTGKITQLCDVFAQFCHESESSGVASERIQARHMGIPIIELFKFPQELWAQIIRRDLGIPLCATGSYDFTKRVDLGDNSVACDQPNSETLCSVQSAAVAPTQTLDQVKAELGL